jgi:type III secretory pathway component EscR
MEAFAGIAFAAAIALAVLALLIPLFVVIIMSRTYYVLQQLEKQTDVLRSLQNKAEEGNQLLRQLLRAYGHEPDA